MRNQTWPEKQTTTVPKIASGQSKKPGYKIDVPPEQISYANLLLHCSWAGIVILAATFILYTLGIIGAYIPPSEIPNYWSLSASEFLAKTGAPQGWGWLTMIKYSDFLNLTGIAFLSLLTIIGYLFLLLPAYIRNKDKPYATIVALEILVLTLAASGLH